MDECSPNHIYLRPLTKLPAQGFKTGDYIEINGDGVVRRVTTTDTDSISFEPPLPSQPFREALIWNWSQRTDFALDTRPGDKSPALKAGKSGQPIGAALDAAAYRRGDFYGDGEAVIVTGVFKLSPKGSGHAVEVPFAHVWTVHEGRIDSLRAYNDVREIVASHAARAV